MTCPDNLPPGFYNEHAEATFHDGLLPTQLNQSCVTEWVTPRAWYDRHIASILDHLPLKSPSRQHHSQAVYWLAKSALKRLINACYAGEISLNDFDWCRAIIREWEKTHQTKTFQEDEIEATLNPSPREWAAQLVRQAVRSASSE